MRRLEHPADRAAFRRFFVEIAESQYENGPAPEVGDCAALLRFAYREALRAARAKIPPLFETAAGPRHFADAKTLQTRNCDFVDRDWRAGAPADLLFYLNLDQNRPYHAMALTNGHAIYHTGGKPGEIRRPALAELALHPEPRWRPARGNPNFLGVYRWRILG